MAKNRPENCSHCRGLGYIPHPNKDDVITCPSCGGTGMA